MKILGGLALLAMLVFVITLLQDSRQGRPLNPEGSALAGSRGAVAESELQAVPEDSRTPAIDNAKGAGVLADDGASTPEAVDSQKLRLVSGLVTDSEGRPVPGLAVYFSSRIPEGKPAGQALDWSRSDGSFRVETEDTGVLFAQDDSYLTLAGSRVTAPNAGDAHYVVVARRARLEGVVLSEDGAPIGSAELEFEVPARELGGFQYTLQAVEQRWWAAKSDESGHFVFQAVPNHPRGSLRTQCGGFLPDRRRVDSGAKIQLHIILQGAASARNAVRGVVFDAGGEPVSGANVLLGSSSAATDNWGRFRIQVPQNLWPSASLVVTKEGYRPAVKQDFGQWLADRDYVTESITVVLQGSELAIAGRVIDVEGKPCPGWRVFVADPTELSPGSFPVTFIEGISRGRGQGAQTTNNEGSFELHGLLEREYVVQAWDPQSLLTVRSAPIAAGTLGITLQVPQDALIDEVSGVVLSRAGVPLSDTSVAVTLVTFGDPGEYLLCQRQMGRSVRTDENGRFRLERVPRRHLYLAVTGDDVSPELFALGSFAGLDRVELRVAEYRRFRFVADGIKGVLSLRALDSEEMPLEIQLLESNSLYFSTWFKVEGEGTPVLAVSEEVRTVVVYSNGQEVGRIPVDFQHGEIATVHL